MSEHEPTWMKFPKSCWATVVRRGEEQACDKPAIAVAVATEEESYWQDRTYPVCKNHARGRDMLTLVDMIRIAKETR